MAEEKEEKSGEGGGKKKSKMKLIIILVVVVLVLAIAGAAVYMLLLKPKGETAEGGDKAHTEEAADHGAAKEQHGEENTDKKEKKEKKKEKKGEESTSFVYSFGAVIVNLADAGSSRYLKVNISMEFDDHKLEEELKKRDAQVKDIIISVLSSKTYADVNNPQGKLSIKQEIIKRVNMVLADGEATNVFFSEFVTQ